MTMDRDATLASIKNTIRKNEAILEAGGVVKGPSNSDTVDRNLSNSTVPPVVSAAHYQLAMSYYKLVGPPEAFYEQAMQFLNFAPYENHQGDQPMDPFYETIAIDLAVAALTGDGVYNLGEVIQNPLLVAWRQSRTSHHVWLCELLEAVATGNVVLFDELTSQTFVTEIPSQPALVNRAVAVREKLTLLAMVHFVLHRPAASRTFDFVELVTAIHVPVDQVEWVIMRALSVHLIEGTIDQVSQQVHITWVQPRVLDATQTMALANRFAEWATIVSQTHGSMIEQTAAFA
jgi:26S proteasome regulatory subunit N9